MIEAAGAQGARRLAHAARLLSGLVHARSVCTPARGRRPSVSGRSVWFNEDGQDRPEAAGAALAAQRSVAAERGAVERSSASAVTAVREMDSYRPALEFRGRPVQALLADDGQEPREGCHVVFERQVHVEFGVAVVAGEPADADGEHALEQ